MILELHGSVANRNLAKLGHRRMLSKDKLLNWAHNHSRFVSVEDALLGKGTAITLDDATFAAYETALELRAMGHEVTIYINMYNVLTGTNYFFHMLSVLLDIFFESNQELIGLDVRAKEDFRRRMKIEFIKSTNETDSYEFLEGFRLKHALEFDYQLPKELQTIGMQECNTLAASGVKLGNHCFDHYNPSVRTPFEFEQGVIQNASLIKQWFNLEDKLCAIPFGKWSPSKSMTSPLQDYIWLLADSSRDPGYISAQTYNRKSIDNDSDVSL